MDFADFHQSLEFRIMGGIFVLRSVLAARRKLENGRAFGGRSLRV